VLENIWVREGEIIDIIYIVDSNKATGPDEISNNMIIHEKRNRQILANLCA
jgi:DNA-directed RNA polymerase sigma subunit (sigma70/sigma32)